MADVTTVGMILDGPKERDAIHVAVASVIAGRGLRPGQHIGFEIDGGTERVSFDAAPLIGIVDPFLKRSVEPGERFWMFLYPNTITSLKHQWTHPAFGPEEKLAAKPKGDVAASEKWLRNFVENANCPDYDTLINAAIGDHHKNSVDGDDDYLFSKIDSYGGEAYLYFGGRDAHGAIPPKFWDHVETVTGRKVPVRATHFTCSC